MAVERVERTDDDTTMMLDYSYFYPEGDGQPADRGTTAAHSFAHLRKSEDGVVHLLAGESGNGLEPGAAVARGGGLGAAEQIVAFLRGDRA